MSILVATTIVVILRAIFVAIRVGLVFFLLLLLVTLIGPLASGAHTTTGGLIPVVARLPERRLAKILVVFAANAVSDLGNEDLNLVLDS